MKIVYEEDCIYINISFSSNIHRDNMLSIDDRGEIHGRLNDITTYDLCGLILLAEEYFND